MEIIQFFKLFYKNIIDVSMEYWKKTTRIFTISENLTFHENVKILKIATFYNSFGIVLEIIITCEASKPKEIQHFQITRLQNLRKYNIFNITRSPNLRKYNICKISRLQNLRKYNIFKISRVQNLRKYNIFKSQGSPNIRKCSIFNVSRLQNLWKYSIFKSRGSQT